MASSAVARRWLESKIGPILSAASPPLTWTPPGASVAVPRITNGVAPSGMPYPFVRIDFLSLGNDEHVLNGNHVRADPLCLVKVVTRSASTKTIEPIVDAIHAALHWQGGMADGGRVIDCRRERPHERKENDGDTVYMNMGGEYRISVSEG